MPTTVIYHTGDCGLVTGDRLDELITKAEIRQFLRLEGWTTIGCDPLRVREQGCCCHERRLQCLPVNSRDLLAIRLNI